MHGYLITPPLTGAFSFSSSDIWFVGSFPIHGDGKNWVMYHLQGMGLAVSVSKAWGTNSNNIYFVGINGSFASYDGLNWRKIESGTKTLAKLYVPKTWEDGSSLYHLDDNTYPAGNSNSLMTHMQENAEVIYSPGEVGLAIMKDLGWIINRLATFTNPGSGIALQKGTIDTVRWTDTEGGAYSLDLTDTNAIFIRTILSTQKDNKGLNQFVWAIPSDLPNGKYKVKIGSGTAYGISTAFTITNLQVASAPTFNYSSGTYPATIWIKARTQTQSAVIRYTINSMQAPTISSPQFPDSMQITTLTTIRAKAFKDSMAESGTTVVSYNIGIEPLAAEVNPPSGAYAQNLKVTISWATDSRCFWSRTEDGTEPHDPSEPGYQYELISNPITYIFNSTVTVNIKVRTYKDGTWGSLVYNQYTLTPGLRIAQIDDEDISYSSFGKWKKWENSQWIEYPDTTFPRPALALIIYF